MIHPRPHYVIHFLWAHLEKDVKVLGQTLGQNMDNTAVTVHLILHTSTGTRGDSDFLMILIKMLVLFV